MDTADIQHTVRQTPYFQQGPLALPSGSSIYRMPLTTQNPPRWVTVAFESVCPELSKYISFLSLYLTPIFNNALRIFYFVVRVLNVYDLYSNIYPCPKGSGYIGSGEAPNYADKWTYMNASSFSVSHAQWNKTLLRLERVCKIVLFIIYIYPAFTVSLQNSGCL